MTDFLWYKNTWALRPSASFLNKISLHLLLTTPVFKVICIVKWKYKERVDVLHIWITSKWKRLKSLPSFLLSCFLLAESRRLYSEALHKRHNLRIWLDTHFESDLFSKHKKRSWLMFRRDVIDSMYSQQVVNGDEGRWDLNKNWWENRNTENNC